MITTATRTTFSSVNLLPPETLKRQKTRRLTGIVAVAGLAVVAVLVLFFVLQSARVSHLRDEVAAQNTQNAALQTEATSLQPYETMRQDLATRQTLVNRALAGDIDWSNILHELSAAIPPSAWFLNVSANASPTASTAVAPPTTGAPSTPSTGIVGSITFQGNALDTGTLSSFLIRLQREPGWVNAWMSTAQKTAVGSTPVWTFSSSVDLTKDVLSRRGGGTR
jgi:Tfp pilus assembly protein PilN